MRSELSKLLNAASFAAGKHRQQRRKDADSSPYINHPLEVASLLADVGAVTDVELLIAALLHDTVEDTDATLQEIEQLFGKGVCGIVAEVTDDKSLPKDQRKQLQVKHAGSKSIRARQLKIADKTCNIRDLSENSPADWDWARKVEYLRWARQVVEECRGANLRLEEAFVDAAKQAEDRIND